MCASTLKDIKLVHFDFDQTIINSKKGFAAAFISVMDEFKKFLKRDSSETNLEASYTKLKDKMQKLDIQKIYNRDLWWNDLLNELGLTEIQFSEKECKSLTKLYWDIAAENSELYSDTLEVLDYLKKRKYLLGLVTDTDGTPGRKQMRLEKSGILNYFDGIIIAGEDTPTIKPDPEPFLKLTSTLACKPENTVMVGDKPFTDIRGAKDAGFHTILILRDNWQIDPTPDYQIRELIELKSIL